MDELLARFVLDDRHDRALWRRWRTSVDLDAASASSHELLPSAFRLLEDADGDPDPDLGRLRGLYRHRWVLRQRHLAAGERAMRDLDDAAVPYLAPVDRDVASLVEDPLVLPLRVPRLTIPDARLRAGLDALLETGWRPTDGTSERTIRRRLVQTEWTLTSSDSTVVIGLDLAPGVHDERYRQGVWRRANPPDGDPGGRHSTATIDLFVSMLWDAAEDRHAWRWAIGALALARHHERIDDAAAVFEIPALGHLLPVTVERSNLLADLDPRCASLGDILTAANDALRRRGPPARTPGRFVRQWRHRRRQAGAVHAAIRRHGGVAGTVEYLRDRRRH